MFIIQPDAAVFTIADRREHESCQTQKANLCEEGHSDVRVKITHELLSDLKDFY